MTTEDIRSRGVDPRRREIRVVSDGLPENTRVFVNNVEVSIDADDVTLIMAEGQPMKVVITFVPSESTSFMMEAATPTPAPSDPVARHIASRLSGPQ